jgi:morphogenetic protein associated with SpoVID
VKIHIVQKGDTLWKIAQKYGVDFEQLKKMNSQLSNPDMIMPGMKIKIPTSSGNVKKETATAKKEMPIAQHPIIQKEQPAMPVKKEAPKKEAPKKEAPAQMYIPKMPQPIIPEIDVNNYYMVNMANMSMQQTVPQIPQVPQVPILPPMEDKLPEVEPVESAEEKPEEPLPMTGGYAMPMFQNCYPISPVLPGTGLPCPPNYQMPFAPFPQTLPAQQAPVQQPMGDQMDESYNQSMDHSMMQPMPYGPMMPMQAPMMPMMQQPSYVQGVQDDCGCGGSQPSQGSMMPSQMPQGGYGTPYMPMPQAPMYPQQSMGGWGPQPGYFMPGYPMYQMNPYGPGMTNNQMMNRSPEFDNDEENE